MGSFSIWHWLIVGAIVMILFGGRGKISELMGDVAKGIKSFKKGLADDEETDDKKSSATKDPRVIDNRPADTAKSEPSKTA
jgi:sec-independent protein translocase protein TatA